MEVERENEHIAAKLIEVCSRDIKSRMQREIGEYLARRQALRRHIYK
jgi:hypothetical protein